MSSRYAFKNIVTNMSYIPGHKIDYVEEVSHWPRWIVRPKQNCDCEGRFEQFCMSG